MTSTITKLLGDEHDERLRDALRDTLNELGAIKRQEQRGVAGSQDVEVLAIEVQGRPLLVESETYVGLSVTGDSDLVELIAGEVTRRLAAKQDGMLSTTIAWAFSSPLSLAEMKERLDVVSSKPWTEAESHYHSDYLSHTVAENTVARIYRVNAGYVVNLRYRSLDNDAALAESRIAAAKSVLLEKILPTVLARDAVETEPLE